MTPQGRYDMMDVMPTEDQENEWWDDGEPEDSGLRLDHEDLGTPWSDLHKGTRVRFKTMNFVKRGTVISIKKRSMRVLFDAHDTPTAIPDAKWYFVQARMGNKNEHLCAISTPALGPSRLSQRHPDEQHTELRMTPSEAAAYLGTDPKNIRRMIRSGRLKATRDGGRWVLLRSTVEKMR